MTNYPIYSSGSEQIVIGRGFEGYDVIGDSHMVTRTEENGEVYIHHVGNDHVEYSEDGEGSWVVTNTTAQARAEAIASAMNDGVKVEVEFTYWRAIYGSDAHNEYELMEDSEREHMARGW